jgi:hypothetical protein
MIPDLAVLVSAGSHSLTGLVGPSNSAGGTCTCGSNLFCIFIQDNYVTHILSLLVLCVGLQDRYAVTDCLKELCVHCLT